MEYAWIVPIWMNCAYFAWILIGLRRFDMDYTWMKHIYSRCSMIAHTDYPLAWNIWFTGKMSYGQNGWYHKRRRITKNTIRGFSFVIKAMKTNGFNKVINKVLGLKTTTRKEMQPLNSWAIIGLLRLLGWWMVITN